jgi:hypothetical protein
MSAWMPWKTTAIFSCADPKAASQGWLVHIALAGGYTVGVTTNRDEP